jgi:hypothetical protein
MKRVDERPDGEDRRSVLLMELINHKGNKRIRRLLSLTKDYGADSRKVLALLEPPDVKGTAFLSRNYAGPAREDHRTILTIEEIRHDAGLRDSLFEVATIQRGHLRY